MFKQQIGSVKLIPSSGGVFEVTLNGQLLYSKRATGKFPDFDILAKEIATKL